MSTSLLEPVELAHIFGIGWKATKRAGGVHVANQTGFINEKDRLLFHVSQTVTFHRGHRKRSLFAAEQAITHHRCHTTSHSSGTLSDSDAYDAHSIERVYGSVGIAQIGERERILAE